MTFGYAAGAPRVLGRLFSSTSENRIRTEIVLLITPRLVRTIARPDVGTSEFAAGTEASTGLVPFGGGAVPAQQIQQQVPDPSLLPVPAPEVPPAPPAAAPVPGNTMTPFGGLQKPAP